MASHVLLLIAHKEHIEYELLMMVLLIRKDRILAGLSAKKEANRIQAIREPF